MEENKNRFNYFEKIFLRISLGLLGSGIIFFFLMLVFIGSIPDDPNQIIKFILSMLFLSIASFFIAIIRILKYILVVNKRNDGSTITGSIISFFTSPVAIIVYYISFIIMAFASCSIQ